MKVTGKETRNNKITEIAQIQMFVFWITLVSSVICGVYLLVKSS